MDTKRLPSVSKMTTGAAFGVPTVVSADPDTSAERDGQPFDEGCEGHVEVDSSRTHDPHLARMLEFAPPALGSSVRAGPVLAARSTHHCNDARAPGTLGGYVTETVMIGWGATFAFGAGGISLGCGSRNPAKECGEPHRRPALRLTTRRGWVTSEKALCTGSASPGRAGFTGVGAHTSAPVNLTEYLVR